MIGNKKLYNRDFVVGVILIILAIIIPFIFNTRYIIGQMTLFFIWATVVSQWNLVFGVAGIFSLAQMAIFAMGGYVTGMLALYLKWSLWVSMFFGGFAAVIFSILIGIACLRLRGAYVALLTLAISQTMYLLIITDTACFMRQGVTCRNFTGGTRGLARFGDFGFREILPYKYMAFGDYFLALTILIFAVIFSFYVIRSPIGMAFQALRDNPECAVARGISKFKYQLLVFSSSAFFTGLAGAAFAGHFRVMRANTLYLNLLLLLMSMLIIGGVGKEWGPLMGAGTLMIVDEILKEFVEWRLAGLGIILVLFIILWPKGLSGFVDLINQKYFLDRKLKKNLA